VKLSELGKIDSNKSLYGCKDVLVVHENIFVIIDDDVNFWDGLRRLSNIRVLEGCAKINGSRTVGQRFRYLRDIRSDE
jgi:hypothetical protein